MTSPPKPSLLLSSRKRSSPALKPLPEAVAWIQNLQLDMTTSVSRRGVQYELHATCQQSKVAEPTRWSVSRSFDQCKAFQKRMLRLPTHTCAAECRWLRSIAKKHFPKQTLFGARCPSIIEQRRKALLQLLTTVQAAIVNHGNRSCKILTEDVSREFAAFLLESSKDDSGAASLPVTPSTSSELELDTPHSLASETSDDDEFDAVALDYDDAWSAWKQLPVQHLSLERTSSSPV